MQSILEDKSFIQVLVSGQIESAQFPGLDGLVCKYSWSYGRDWGIKLGLNNAISQRGTKTSAGDQLIVWNFPVDCTFQSTEPFGWPQINLRTFGSDFYGRDVIRGYGAVHVPTQPGRHTLYVKMFAPQSSSPLQQFLSYMSGKLPEYQNPKFASEGKLRSVTRSHSVGTVKITVNVILNNLKQNDIVTA